MPSPMKASSKDKKAKPEVKSGTSRLARLIFREALGTASNQMESQFRWIDLTTMIKSRIDKVRMLVRPVTIPCMGGSRVWLGGCIRHRYAAACQRVTSRHAVMHVPRGIGLSGRPRGKAIFDGATVAGLRTGAYLAKLILLKLIG